MAELRIEDAVDALMVEQALVMSRELKRSCQSAPHGQVLAAAEQVAVAQARELARRGLEAALTAQRDEVEKKGAAAAAAPVAGLESTGGHARGTC